MTNPPDAQSLITTLAASRDAVPAEAIQQALDHWDTVGPELVQAVADYADGRDSSQRVGEALLPIIHAAAEARDTSAFDPVCRLVALPVEQSGPLLGGALIDTLGGILTATWNGDTAPLETLLHNRQAPDLAHGSAMAALAWLTVAGHVSDDKARDILGRLPDVLPPEEGDEVRWAAWADTISALGLESLADKAESVLLSGLFDEDVVDTEAFREDLADAANEPDAIRAQILDSHMQPLDDAVGALEELREREEAENQGEMASADGMQPEDFGDPDGLNPGDGEEAGAPAVEPHTNPYRDVGRNDPCPCGSGQKFKKCCGAA